MDRLYINIKKFRIDKGWSQTELAERVGYSDKSMISQIENGKVNLPASKIEKFAEVFGVSTSELTGDRTPLRTYSQEVYTITPETMKLAATLEDLEEGEPFEVIRIGKSFRIIKMPKMQTPKAPLPKRVVVRKNNRFFVKKRPTMIPVIHVDDVDIPTPKVIGKPAKSTPIGKKKKLVPT